MPTARPSISASSGVVEETVVMPVAPKITTMVSADAEHRGEQRHARPPAASRG